jgi:hypothetical protein
MYAASNLVCPLGLRPTFQWVKTLLVSRRICEVSTFTLFARRLDALILETAGEVVNIKLLLQLSC